MFSFLHTLKGMLKIRISLRTMSFGRLRNGESKDWMLNKIELLTF